MEYIVFSNIDKKFANQQVLKNLSLSIRQGELATLLGPSGCGKSTLLRSLAGLESIDSGAVYLDGEEITHKDPKKRNIGMVFQQYSLFPTMTVFDNVAFGLSMRNEKKAIIKEEVKEILALVELSGKEDNYPAELSGGEQQRVALARSLIMKPKVLLLDEPFSAIDAKLRKELQIRVREIHNKLDMTTIFVTHDQDEAMAMSDTIHLMNNGIIEQSGTPASLYSSPTSLFVAEFMGNYNIIELDDHEEYKKVSIRPESIKISRERIEDSDEVLSSKGSIKDIIYQGNIIRYLVACDFGTLKVDALFTDENVLDIDEEIYIYSEIDNIKYY